MTLPVDLSSGLESLRTRSRRRRSTGRSRFGTIAERCKVMIEDSAAIRLIGDGVTVTVSNRSVDVDDHGTM
jgi:hypothetical protein